eukprot:GILI01000962.1.p1 GENE.GILI01000962.1~~GILI01000962.1.p1  ORF type:complete len:183 (+),score=84.52 GILI01000962.1:37-549(+)
MKIYRDIFSGEEVLCDNDMPLVLEDDVVYKVTGRLIEIGGEDFGISSNVEEDAEEGATADGQDNSKAKVVDIVHNQQLQETSFDKASYVASIKGYMKKLKEKLDETDAEAGKVFAAGAQTFVKKVVKEIDEYQFFTGPNMDFDAMIILCKWEGEVPTFYYWKDGLKGERV